jgi:hypothetical protein
MTPNMDDRSRRVLGIRLCIVGVAFVLFAPLITFIPAAHNPDAFGAVGWATGMSLTFGMVLIALGAHLMDRV